MPMSEAMPEGFPPNTLATQRALTALNMRSPEKLADTLSALYEAFWVDKKPVQCPEVVVPVLARVLNLSEADAKDLYSNGSSAEAKSLLVKNTDAAFDDGAFGLPWFVGSSMFSSTR